LTPERDPDGRHVIADLGLSFPADSSWAIDSRPLGDDAIVTARLDDVATFYVRYGPGQSLDAFLGGLGDALTEARIVSDETASLLGQSARRVTVLLAHKGRAIPGPRSTPPLRLVVTAFSVGGVPVLAGYRVPEEVDEMTVRTLEGVVSGLAVDRSYQA
jgi:hypothetical protein